MLTNTNTSSAELTATGKNSFSNASIGLTNSNSIENNNNRYSPSNFYRAAAVAAATSDSNNRRYMPSTPWSKSNCFGDSFKLEAN
ncbi:unnamed protein product, partial [Rotaria magnacalcarata]